MLGTLRLPLMILLASSPASAAGTNIGVSAASAAAGSVRHAREGRVSWPVVWWMLPPSVIGAFLGGYFGSDLPDAALLGVAAGILVFNGLDLLLRPFDAKPRTRLRIAPAVLGGLGVGALGGAIGVILGTMRSGRTWSSALRSAASVSPLMPRGSRSNGSCSPCARRRRSSAAGSAHT